MIRVERRKPFAALFGAAILSFADLGALPSRASAASGAARVAAPTAPSGFSENFDGVTMPALPPGWVATNAQGPGPLWVTDSTNLNIVGNAAYIDDPKAVGDKRLDSPPIFLLADSAVLQFRQGGALSIGPNYEPWDGGVLEISVDGGPFQDIVDAGGVFLLYGYEETIAGSDNPLAGRSGWTNHPAGGVIVRLPPVGGSTVVLRWRMGSSTETSARFVEGWWIDAIKICDGYSCDAIPVPEAVGVDRGGNGVWEPNETVSVEPYYFNNAGGTLLLTGTATGLTGPGGPRNYKINGPNADYGAIPSGALGGCSFTGSCYNLQNLGARTTLHWDAQFSESLSTGASVTWALHIGESFTDVPTSHGFYSFIEKMLHNGITTGCGTGIYCPGNDVTRAQMAVFILRAEHGSDYAPPDCTLGFFADVVCTPGTPGFAEFIQQLYNEGITSGCGKAPLRYCPDGNVTRAQMAVFLLRAEHGSGYVPPDCIGIFTDVACTPTKAFVVDFIERLKNEGITSGCGTGTTYCPNAPATRGEMAVFLTRTFRLLL